MSSDLPAYLIGLAETWLTIGYLFLLMFAPKKCGLIRVCFIFALSMKYVMYNIIQCSKYYIAKRAHNDDLRLCVNIGSTIRSFDHSCHCKQKILLKLVIFFYNKMLH